MARDAPKPVCGVLPRRDLSQVAMQFHEHVLSDLFRSRRILQKMVRDAVNHSLVLAHKAFEVHCGCHRRFRDCCAAPLSSPSLNTAIYGVFMAAGCKIFLVCRRADEGLRCVDRTMDGTNEACVAGPKSRRPALQRAFEGRKLLSQCADGRRTLSSSAV